MNNYNNGDKVYTFGDIEKLEAENAALRAQVEQLREAYKAVSKKIHDIDETETDSDEIADELWQGLFDLLRDGYEMCQATPAQYLAEVRAQAVQCIASELELEFPHHKGVHAWLVGWAHEIRQQAKEQ